jgi:hypothetical protein
LKVRVDHLVIGVGAVLLLIGSVVAWQALRPDPEQAELDDGLERLRSSSGDPAHQAKPRLVRGFVQGRSRTDERQGWSASELPAGDPNEVGPDQAVDEFKAAISELEAAVARGGKLSDHEQAELYNRATGSFTALSTWIDASDASEREVIDDAYAQMMSLMKQLEFEPPQHDPDAMPLRR